MINRCQSDLILSNRCIETQYKRVDKYLDKCKSLLRGIQREFKKTRNFWEKVKSEESLFQKEIDRPQKEYKGESLNLKNKNCSCSIIKGEDGANSKNKTDFETDQFSKIPKLDVKRLEAFLNIVQKTQVHQSGSECTSNSIKDGYNSFADNDDYHDSLELDVFEDALCHLEPPSTTSSLIFDHSRTSSNRDIFPSTKRRLDAWNSQITKGGVKSDVPKDSHPEINTSSPIADNSQLLNRNEIRVAEKFKTTNPHPTPIDNIDIFTKKCEKFYRNLDQLSKEIAPIISGNKMKNASFNGGNSLKTVITACESDSDEYVEASDVYHDCKQEVSTNSKHSNVFEDRNSASEPQERKEPGDFKMRIESDELKNENQMPVEIDGKTDTVKDISVEKNKGKCVSFSGCDRIAYQNERFIAKQVARDDFNYQINKRDSDEEIFRLLEREVEGCSRLRSRKRRRTSYKRRVREITRSRSPKKSFNDMATGTSDLETFEFSLPNTRFIKYRNKFSSSSANPKYFDHSIQEYGGIFGSSMCQPYDFQKNKDLYESCQSRNEYLIKKHTASLNRFLRKTFSGSEISDKNSTSTFSVIKSTSSSSEHITAKMGSEYLNDDWKSKNDYFSIHNSTILNRSETNILVFRSEDVKIPKGAGKTGNMFGETSTSNNFSPRSQSSQSSLEQVPSTGGQRNKIRNLTKLTVSKKTTEGKDGISKGMEQRNRNETKINSSKTSVYDEEGEPVTKLSPQPVTQCVGYIYGNQIRMPRGAKLVNETKIIHQQSQPEVQRKTSNNGSTKLLAKVSALDESNLVKRGNMGSGSFDNYTSEIRSDSDVFEEDDRPPSRSKRALKIRERTSSNEKFRLVGSKTNIQSNETIHKTSNHSAISLNSNCTVFTLDKSLCKGGLEPKVIISTDNVHPVPVDSKETILTTVNLSKSSLSVNEMDLESSGKLRERRQSGGSKHLPSVESNNHFYSKINIFPLADLGRGFIQKVSIFGQQLYIQGAVSGSQTSPPVKQMIEPEISRKLSSVSLRATEVSPTSNLAVQSKTICHNNKINTSPKINENTNRGREVHSKNFTKTDTKPRFIPYVNRNYTSNHNANPRPKVDRHQTLKNEKKIEKKTLIPPVVLRKTKVDNSSASTKVNKDEDKNLDSKESEKIIGSSIASKESSNSGSSIQNTEGPTNKSNLSVSEPVGDGCSRKKIEPKKSKSDENNSITSSESSGKYPLVDKQKKKKSKAKSDEKSVDDEQCQPTRKKLDLHRNSSDLTLMNKKKNPVVFENKRQLSSKSLKKQQVTDELSEEEIAKRKALKDIRRKLSEILPMNSSIRQIVLRNLKEESAEGIVDYASGREVDVFGAPLVNNLGENFYNEFGYPNLGMSGNSLYRANGMPTRGAYGKPLHTNLRKELSLIVEGTEKRRNVFHRANRHFEEELLHVLQTISNVKMDMYGRVYDSFGRPLFDRYGYMLYDRIGNPLTDAYGRRLTDKYGVSIINPNTKCANVVLPSQFSSNDSITSQHLSDNEKTVKKRTEPIKHPSSRETAWKKCKRQVSFNMDPYIISMNHSDSEVETLK